MAHEPKGAGGPAKSFVAVALVVCLSLHIGFRETGAVASPGNDRFLPIDLGEYFNNDGVSFEADTLDGDLDFFCTTLPAEALPAAGSLIFVGEVPFVFPAKDDGCLNNVATMGTSILLPVGPFKAAHFIITATNGTKRGVFSFVYEDGPHLEIKATVNALSLKPRPRDQVAVETPYVHGVIGRIDQPARLWLLSVALDPSRNLTAVTLPDVFDIHIFALTLERAE